MPPIITSRSSAPNFITILFPRLLPPINYFQRRNSLILTLEISNFEERINHKILFITNIKSIILSKNLITFDDFYPGNKRPSIAYSRMVVRGVERIFSGVPRLPAGFRVALPRGTHARTSGTSSWAKNPAWWPLIHSPSKARNHRASSVKAKWGEGLRGWMCRRGL